MPTLPLTNLEIPIYQSKTKFNGVYCGYHLPKVKDRAFVTNLDEY